MPLIVIRDPVPLAINELHSIVLPPVCLTVCCTQYECRLSHSRCRAQYLPFHPNNEIDTRRSRLISPSPDSSKSDATEPTLGADECSENEKRI